MNLFTLTEIAEAFAKVDGIDAADRPSYHKEVRNLCQRAFLPPSVQRGRIFCYSLPRAITIRIVQLLHRYGTRRTIVDQVCMFILGGTEDIEGDIVEACLSGAEDASLVVTLDFPGFVNVSFVRDNVVPVSPHKNLCIVMPMVDMTSRIRSFLGEPLNKVALFNYDPSGLPHREDERLHREYWATRLFQQEGA